MPKCECPATGRAVAKSSYSPAEYKAMRHEPGECAGDYNIQRYRRGAQTLWLCSTCRRLGDVEVDDVQGE